MTHMRSRKIRGAVLAMISMLFCVGCSAMSNTVQTTPTNAPQTTAVPATVTPTTTDAEPAPVRLDLEKDVLYFGRTYAKSRIHWFNWSGSGFVFRFQGSCVAAEFYSNAPDTRNLAYLKVYVDGVEMEDILLKEESQIVMLAEGLDPEKEHTVEVRKRTNARSSTAGVGRIVLMDGTILTPPEPKERLIEFLGDSLTVGYVAAKGGKTATAWSTTTEDVTGTYCPQIAGAFGAEYHATAISGRGIVRNNGGDTDVLFPDIYPQLDLYNNPGVEYDFARQPDVIVINLGTNDESAANAQLSKAVFQEGLYQFLKVVRQHNPDAQIVCAYGMVRIGLSADIEAVVNRLQAEGDNRIHYLQLEQCQSWELNLNHTVSTAYTSRADALIEKIGEITGWKAEG